MEKYNVSLRKLLQQGISEPEFYNDIVYRIRKNVGKSNFAEQFRKRINRYKRIGYIEDIYFFEVNTKYISSNLMKISVFSRV